MSPLYLNLAKNSEFRADKGLGPSTVGSQENIPNPSVFVNLVYSFLGTSPSLSLFAIAVGRSMEKAGFTFPSPSDILLPVCLGNDSLFRGQRVIEEKPPRYRWVMLALLMLLSLVHGLGIAIMPALFDEIKDALDLKHAQVGIIWGAVALGTLLTSIVGGALGDRFGAKRVISIGLLAITISLVLRAILPSFGGLIVTMLLFGMAFGFVAPNQSKALGMWFGPRELGRSLGLLTVEGAAGWAIALMLGATLSSALGGWENVMLLMAAITFGGLIVWMALARERPIAAADHATQALSYREKLGRIIRVRDLWLVSLMGVFITGAIVANVGLLPETLKERGMTSSMAGSYMAISTWTVAVASVFGPGISDRIGWRKRFIWPPLLICVATVTFFGVFTGPPLIPLLVVYSLALGTALPLFRAIILENESIGPLFAGSAFGIIGTVTQIGSTVLPYAMGAVIDVTGEYWPGFVLLAVLIAIGTALAAATKETGWKAKAAALPGGPTNPSSG